MMKTVLVVEDSGSSRDITSHFLQQGGFRVLEAADGAEALEIVRKRHVDLILTDIMMPNMDGWELYREVRKNPDFNLTPFVFLTVLDEMENQVKGLGLGVDDYIPKPVTPPQLIARVNTAFMRSERLKEFTYRNPVTGLETASYLMHRLPKEVARCRETGQELGLVVVGISNYVSLVRGQADWFALQASSEAGKKLKSQLRSFDMIADMGEGRFAVLLPGKSQAESKAWADEASKKWNLSLVWPETEQNISVEIATSADSLTDGDVDAGALLRKRLESFERKW